MKIRNSHFKILVLPVIFSVLIHCRSEKSNEKIMQLDPPLNTPLRYSLSASRSETYRTDRKHFDSTNFTLVFIEKDDSIFSCKLYLNYLATRFPNGRQVTTNDSISTIHWNRDYIPAISFLQKQAVRDSFWIVMHSNGTILRVDGFDSIVNRLSKRFNIDKRTVRGLLQERVGNEAIKDMLAQQFFYLPGKPVKKGDNWIRNVTVSVKAPVKYSNFIKVREMNSDTVTLDVQSAITARTGEGGSVYEEGKRTFWIMVSQNSGLPLAWSGSEETVYTAQGSIIRKSVLIQGRKF